MPPVVRSLPNPQGAFGTQVPAGADQRPCIVVSRSLTP